VIKYGWLLFSPLAAVWTHAFTCAQNVSYFHIWSFPECKYRGGRPGRSHYVQ